MMQLLDSSKTKYGIPEVEIKNTWSGDHEQIEAWESDVGALGTIKYFVPK